MMLGVVYDIFAECTERKEYVKLQEDRFIDYMGSDTVVWML